MTVNRRAVLVSMLGSSLAGCADWGKLPDLAADRLPAKGNALLVARINLRDEALAAPGRQPKAAISLADERNRVLASAVIDLALGTNFRVIELPAGEFSWYLLYEGTASASLRERLVFTLAPDRATYVGDLDIEIDWGMGGRRYALDVVDRRDEAESRFRVACPAAAAALPLVTSIPRDHRVPAYR